MIQLNRPIVFFDLETTGVSITQDRIVEISCLKVSPDGSRDGKTQRINPLMPIPEEASAVHGITDADVASCPTFRQLASGLWDFIKDCDLGGFNNIRFDVPLLAEEFGRVGMAPDFGSINIVDAQIIFHKNEPRDLSSALRFYCDRDMVGAHAAENDIIATWDIFAAQVDKYSLTSIDEIAKEYVWSDNTLDYAGKIAKNEKGEAIFTFGKHKDKRLLDHRDYCVWMLDNDFPTNTKMVIQKIINPNAYK